MALAILHNVIIGQPVRLDACISKGKGCAKRTYNATLCNLASADLHTGINGTVVVVGVKCLFALFFRIGQLFATAGTRMAMCCGALAKTTQKV